MTRLDIADLADALALFAEERDWAQFHTPKNLAMALAVEVAELMEPFQWMPSWDGLPESKIRAVTEEVGDVLIYLVMLCDALGINPVDAAWAKLEINRRKYPAEKVRGSAAKYTELP